MQTVTEDVDYLGIGPVFATTTKKDAGKAIGLQELKALKKQTSLPVVAIGGINESNAKETMLTRRDRYRCRLAICGAASPYEATKKLRAEIKMVTNRFLLILISIDELHRAETDKKNSYPAADKLKSSRMLAFLA